MAGPTSKAAALAWIQNCLRSGQYIPAEHFDERLFERNVSMDDVYNVVEKPTKCTAYHNGTPRWGGTCRRVTGLDVDGTTVLAVGVEAYMDANNEMCILCIVMKRF